MATPALPLSSVVDVVVEISPQLPASPTFNQALIVGTTDVIPTVGANARLRPYPSLVAMATDGYATTDPEYIGAGLVFGQATPPQTVFIGRQDLTALKTIAINAGAGDGGAGYAIGDTFLVVQAGAQAGVGKVTAIGTNGLVTGIVIIEGLQGTGYSVATGLATTAKTGVGVGLLVDITAIGETPLQAVTACRAASGVWWSFTVLETLPADVTALATFAQAQIPQCAYFFVNDDVAELNGGTTTLFGQLKAQSFNRTFGLYSTTQGGLFPNNAYAQCAVMGVAMGLNTGLAASAFTLKFKTLAGVGPEPLTLAQLNAVQQNNGNTYVTYSSFTWLEQGVMSNGQYFDEIINLDMLASDIQFNVADLLVSNIKTPQTDAGQTMILNAVNQACSNAANRGFLAGGVWQGANILNLITPGTSIPNGYMAVSPKYSTQSAADRQARKSMPVYVAIIEAGAVHFVTIGVFVQR